MIESIKNFLGGRAYAYRGVFDPNNVHTRKVLSDLSKFCRADRSCFDPNPQVAALQEGRREVWMRIKNHLELTDEQLYAIYQEGK